MYYDVFIKVHIIIAIEVPLSKMCIFLFIASLCIIQTNYINHVKDNCLLFSGLCKVSTVRMRPLRTTYMTVVYEQLEIKNGEKNIITYNLNVHLLTWPMPNYSKVVNTEKWVFKDLQSL